MTFLKNLFGGGGVDKKAQKEAEQLQAVSTDRQLQEANRQAALVEGAGRKAPRGQRLFSDGPADAPTKFGS